MNNSKSSNLVWWMAHMAVLTALIVILAFTPLGYLQIGVIKITFLIVPVGTGAILYGPIAGAYLGFVFGMTSFAQCFGMDVWGTTLMNVQPVLCFLMCVASRTLMGYLTGVVYLALHKVLSEKKLLVNLIAALCAALFNTILFVGSMLAFFGQSDYILSLRGGMGLLQFIGVMVGLNGILEMVVSAVVTSGLVRALQSMITGKANAHRLYVRKEGALSRKLSNRIHRKMGNKTKKKNR